MRTALDTNIVSGLLRDNPKTSEVHRLLRNARGEGSLLISAVVYAELLAYPGVTPDILNSFLSTTGVQVHFLLDEAVWTEAGLRFARYSVRRQKATRELPRRLLADFLIGAHALATADRLFTFDTKVFRQDFPELHLYPEPAQ